jgi:hypothetical protein
LGKFRNRYLIGTPAVIGRKPHHHGIAQGKAYFVRNPKRYQRALSGGIMPSPGIVAVALGVVLAVYGVDKGVHAVKKGVVKVVHVFHHPKQ